jgi:hypothetical protein
MPIHTGKVSPNSGRTSISRKAQLQQEEDGQRRQHSASMSAHYEPTSPAGVMQLQRTIGNKAVAQLMRAKAAIQRKVDPPERESDKEKNGMPDQLRTGLENLSGYAMDDVQVHYNSDKPQALNALAYAQGDDIHLAPGQEEHLPHEAWHVVQQRQGRVSPTLQTKGGAAINDDAALESEADRMGKQAIQMKSAGGVIQLQQTKVFVKNITGSYTDKDGVAQPINYPTKTHIATTKSHPSSMVSYEADIKQLLRDQGEVPKSIPDSQINITYDCYGQKQ